MCVFYPISGRQQLGEYHHLFPELKKDGTKFFEYTRMEKETFVYVLSLIENRLLKRRCNWHTQPVLPEERLVITLR